MAEMNDHGGLIATLILAAGLTILAVLSWLERRRTRRPPARQVVADAIAEAQTRHASPSASRRLRADHRDEELWRAIDTYRATHDSTGEEHE